jgi:hypothetical protein
MRDVRRKLLTATYQQYDVLAQVYVPCLAFAVSLRAGAKLWLLFTTAL